MERQNFAFRNVQQAESSCDSNDMEVGDSSPINHGPSNPNNSGAEWRQISAIQLDALGEDLYLPRDKVVRIMQQVLPPHAEISSDALETMQECVSKFVSFVTGEASKRCKRDQRKIVTVQDLVSTMDEELGLKNYVELLLIYYDRYNDQNVADKSGHGGVPVSVTQIAANDVMPPPPPSLPHYGYDFQATPGTSYSNVG